MSGKIFLIVEENITFANVLELEFQAFKNKHFLNEIHLLKFHSYSQASDYLDRNQQQLVLTLIGFNNPDLETQAEELGLKIRQQHEMLPVYFVVRKLPLFKTASTAHAKSFSLLKRPVSTSDIAKLFRAHLLSN